MWFVMWHCLHITFKTLALLYQCSAPTAVLSLNWHGNGASVTLPVARIHESFGSIGNDSEPSNGTILECVKSGFWLGSFSYRVGFTVISRPQQTSLRETVCVAFKRGFRFIWVVLHFFLPIILADKCFESLTIPWNVFLAPVLTGIEHLCKPLTYKPLRLLHRDKPTYTNRFGLQWLMKLTSIATLSTSNPCDKWTVMA